MITKILTIEDVKQFAKQLTAEGLSFHPDDDFNDYINFTTNTPSYTKEDAEVRNELMNECFEICEKEGVDIYEIMMEELLLESGLDKIIPLPSKQ
ncbi:hypothetical protein [Flavobacterium hercynium]|uniref:Uncharacterized protein n=1 Tax=Flavobacterium hercynium TaxID=387094 RepID=A0A226HI06_9FLAO|nr:hypothetical protein [Flavobacterium hercynium]OXA93792.1 hypothetical protein B0A66_05955 [Flavobacterium hercynium]SMP20371.1 hypothetical protein SAMN06265346_106172 [Flavobacterium hercynium]